MVSAWLYMERDVRVARRGVSGLRWWLRCIGLGGKGRRRGKGYGLLGWTGCFLFSCGRKTERVVGMWVFSS